MTTRSRARVGVVAAGAAVLLAGTAVVWGVTTGRPAATGAAAAVPVGTAAVTRGTVTQRVRIPGTYGFDGSYAVVHQGPAGIVTTTAAPGATVERGGILYAVDNRAVRLLYGDLPAYRDFGPGMTDGPDVRQLEQNLVDLGLGGQITVDDRFTTATGTAVRQWQAAWGLPAAERTGTLPLGQVVFLPAAVRIADVTVAAGTAIGPNEPALAATSTARVVTAAIGADRQASVKVGDEVMVSLSTAPPIPGTIVRIGRVATVPGSGDGGNGSNGDGQVGPATVTMVIGLTAPSGLPDLDQAPALVVIAASVRENVLLVPVAALLARPGGGYQVRRAAGELVEVKPGLFDDTTGKVEVSGALQVGDLIEVPVS